MLYRFILFTKLNLILIFFPRSSSSRSSLINRHLIISDSLVKVFNMEIFFQVLIKIFNPLIFVFLLFVIVNVLLYFALIYAFMKNFLLHK